MSDSTHLILRFNQLLRDVESGSTDRNSFRPWEVELLLDMQTCALGPDRKRVLRRYRKAAQRRMEHGCAEPLKLSEYLARSRRIPRAPAASSDSSAYVSVEHRNQADQRCQRDAVA
ncbi:MAG TPA: hypothetical protein VF767_09660 [Bryobacteraceae bacterium]